ncbi:hypothetical protein DM01DRAFT_1330810 [Hesseltinella vesiculosa]|uniref:Uncharacterized protein n=1 Tax=Hesseltinella vesiculosa TaxID=101127 RepID=A0A1X2GX62_9FUNG|nr:hypothetical protein DM01DRAFT_1330810 [Hesseltinella vesiculosa]
MLALAIVSMLLFLAGLVYAVVLHTRRKLQAEKQILRGLLAILLFGLVGRILSVATVAYDMQPYYNGMHSSYTTLPEILIVPMSEMGALVFPVAMVQARGTKGPWYTSMWGWCFILTYCVAFVMYLMLGVFLFIRRYKLLMGMLPIVEVIPSNYGPMIYSVIGGSLGWWLVLMFLAIVIGFHSRLHRFFYVYLALVSLDVIMRGVTSVPSTTFINNISMNFPVSMMFSGFVMLCPPLALLVAVHSAHSWVGGYSAVHTSTFAADQQLYNNPYPMTQHQPQQQQDMYRLQWEEFYAWQRNTQQPPIQPHQQQHEYQQQQWDAFYDWQRTQQQPHPAPMMEAPQPAQQPLPNTTQPKVELQPLLTSS